MTYLQENIKLALASVLAFVVVITPMVIGYQVSQFIWGLCFSGVVLLAIKLFYECGKHDGSFEKRGVTHLNTHHDAAEQIERLRSQGASFADAFQQLTR